MKRKTYRRIFIALSVFLAFFVLLMAGLLVLLVLSITVDGDARTLPSYAREDISAIVAKESWTDEDYETLYLQTGLSRAAVDAVKSAGGLSTLYEYQDNLFYEGEVRHEFTEELITTLHDLLYEPDTGKLHRALLAPLEDGDVIVTSSSHTFGWRNGHAALVVDASAGSVLESVVLGRNSQVTYGGARWFTSSPNFIVLRLKNAAAEERAEIAQSAKELLQGVPYSLTVGLFSAKDQCSGGEKKASCTNCAHLVWQAFYNFGYDTDGTGGCICTVHDLAISDLFEVVQVYGFDPVALW